MVRFFNLNNFLGEKSGNTNLGEWIAVEEMTLYILYNFYLEKLDVILIWLLVVQGVIST